MKAPISPRRTVAILVLFDVIWALAVFGQMQTLWWQACAVFVVIVLARRVWILASSIALCGLILDAVLIQQQILSLQGLPKIMPMNLALLWIAFGFCLSSCQNHLPTHWSQMALLGCFLGTIGYLLAHYFNALSLGPTLLLGSAIIGLCWATLFGLGAMLLRCKLSM